MVTRIDNHCEAKISIINHRLISFKLKQKPYKETKQISNKKNKSNSHKSIPYATCYYMRTIREGMKYNLFKHFKTDVWTAGLKDETLQYKQWLGNQVIKHREENDTPNSVSNRDVINELIKVVDYY